MKFLVWNFLLFSKLVSICCKTFRNVSDFGLSHFWVCFNLFQLIYYIIYMFQCFSTRNIYGLEFSPFLSPCFNLLRNVSKSFKFRNWLFLGLFQFVSVDLLYNLYVSMFRNKKYIWPGIFTFSLTLFQFVVKRFETFQFRT